MKTLKRLHNIEICQDSGCKYSESCYLIKGDNLKYNDNNTGKSKRYFRCPIIVEEIIIF